MKKMFYAFLFLLMSNAMFSQQDTSLSKKFLNESLVLDVNYYKWLDYPSNISLENNCTEVNVSTYFFLTGKEKNISVAMGAHINAANVYGNFTINKDKYGAPVLNPIPDSLEYSKNKITVAYIGMPIEIRFKTNNNIRKKNFKFTIGGNMSYNLTSFRKYIGDDFISGTNEKIKVKLYNQPGISKITGTFYVKAFYDKFGINFRYNVTPFFDVVAGEVSKIKSFSVGLSVIIF